MSQNVIAALAVEAFVLFGIGYAIGWRNARNFFGSMNEAYRRELDRVEAGDVERRVRMFQ